MIAVVHDSILAGLYKELGVETVCPTDLVLKDLIADRSKKGKGEDMYIIIVGAGKGRISSWKVFDGRRS